MVVEVVQIVAVVEPRHRCGGWDPGAGRGRGDGRRRGRREGRGTQALDSPTLLTDPHVAARLQEGPRRSRGGHQRRGWGKGRRRWRRRAAGGVDAQRVL